MEYINDNKILHAFKARTVRELVDEANNLKIPRENVVTVLSEGGQYVLLYYYEGI